MFPAIPLVLAVSGLLGFGGPPGMPRCSPNRSAQPALQPLAQPTTITGASSSPLSVSFNLNDPDAAPVTGSGSVGWNIVSGFASSTWTLGINSTGVSFTNCGEIPPGAVTAQCSSVGTQGSASGSCTGSAVTLTSSPQRIAGGTQKNGTGAYNVNVKFSITDAWKYIGHTTTSCTLGITYTITAN
jgi:hypothetical protein